jgi:ABC-2 type transport system permease protein
VALAIALTVAFAWALSWIFVLIGLLLRAPSAVSSLGLVVLFPLTLASNTFADPATMPSWLRAFVAANPVSHLVTATRAAMDGTTTATAAAAVLATTGAITALFAPLTMHIYRRTR